MNNHCAKYDNVTMSAFLDKLTSLHDISHCTGLFSVDDVQTAILQLGICQMLTTIEL